MKGKDLLEGVDFTLKRAYPKQNKLLFYSKFSLNKIPGFGIIGIIVRGQVNRITEYRNLMLMPVVKPSERTF
jgi:hypothetical protein